MLKQILLCFSEVKNYFLSFYVFYFTFAFYLNFCFKKYVDLINSSQYLNRFNSYFCHCELYNSDFHELLFEILNFIFIYM
jgi:hypothetical protein